MLDAPGELILSSGAIFKCTNGQFFMTMNTPNIERFLN
jgi:hypothetical protein